MKAKVLAVTVFLVSGFLLLLLTVFLMIMQFGLGR